jgi:hypothetical protein
VTAGNGAGEGEGGGGGGGSGDRASAPARLDAVLDRLIAEHTHDAAEVLAAREDYEARRGKVHQDEELWERWSAAFVEWFVLERIRPGADLPPAVMTLRAARDAGETETAAIVAALLRSHRSLFEIRDLAKGTIEVLDLLGGGAFVVDEPRTMHGVEVGDVAELRLVGWNDAVWFGRTFVFHPKEARAAILDHARALIEGGKSRRDVIDHVAALRVRVTRYRHVAPAKVYELGSKVGG